jgi:hypothetical protein
MGSSMTGVVVGRGEPPAGSTVSPMVCASPSAWARTGPSVPTEPVGSSPPERVPET